MTKKILTCLLLCLMTAGCKHDNTIKGWCVGKEHKPAYSIVQHNPTRRVVYPETWNLWIADSVMVHHVCVSEQTYNNISKGEYVRLKHWTNYGKTKTNHKEEQYPIPLLRLQALVWLAQQSIGRSSDIVSLSVLFKRQVVQVLEWLAMREFR